MFELALSMADGSRQKSSHINMSLQPMALPWWAFLHKLPMSVAQKPTTSFRHLTTLV